MLKFTRCFISCIYTGLAFFFRDFRDFRHVGVTLKGFFVIVLKQTIKKLVLCFAFYKHSGAHTRTHTHKASLIEFIGEWMLTRPLQVG